MNLKNTVKYMAMGAILTSGLAFATQPTYAAKTPMVAWGKVMLKEGQLGKVVISKETKTFQLKDGEMVETKKKLGKGREYGVYGTKTIEGSLYYNIGGEFVKQDAVKYQTPSTTLKAKLDVAIEKSKATASSSVKGKGISMDLVKKTFEKKGYEVILETSDEYVDGWVLTDKKKPEYSEGKRLLEYGTVDKSHPSYNPKTPVTISTVYTGDSMDHKREVDLIGELMEIAGYGKKADILKLIDKTDESTETAKFIIYNYGDGLEIGFK